MKNIENVKNRILGKDTTEEIKVSLTDVLSDVANYVLDNVTNSKRIKLKDPSYNKNSISIIKGNYLMEIVGYDSPVRNNNLYVYIVADIYYILDKATNKKIRLLTPYHGKVRLTKTVNGVRKLTNEKLNYVKNTLAENFVGLIEAMEVNDNFKIHYLSMDNYCAHSPKSLNKYILENYALFKKICYVSNAIVYNVNNIIRLDSTVTVSLDAHFEKNKLHILHTVKNNQAENSVYYIKMVVGFNKYNVSIKTAVEVIPGEKKWLTYDIPTKELITSDNNINTISFIKLEEIVKDIIERLPVRIYSVRSI